MKKWQNFLNPESKKSRFKCQMCGTGWIKPVPYYIIGTHPAIEKLVGYTEREVCLKCVKREMGSKNKHKKEFLE
ncbi:MAG: hypothetical protein GOVbin2066_9 [Prokaryotic dsDNA virus sp.]|nr:MAG: hypothetical protein GOVbin2066_9 [Prokaryotic dsDNA virus sp.]